MLKGNKETQEVQVHVDKHVDKQAIQQQTVFHWLKSASHTYMYLPLHTTAQHIVVQDSAVSENTQLQEVLTIINSCVFCSFKLLLNQFKNTIMSPYRSLLQVTLHTPLMHNAVIKVLHNVYPWISCVHTPCARSTQ